MLNRNKITRNSTPRYGMIPSSESTSTTAIHSSTGITSAQNILPL